MSDSSQREIRLVVVSAGVSDPSSSRLLADRITGKTLELLRQSGTQASASVAELAPLAVDIARATVAGFPSEQLQAAIERVAAADALIAVTPIYKAGVSGLFKSFVDILDNDLLVAKPVLLAATAGTSRHALVIDEQLRPLFGYMRALVLPTSVFAGPEDWAASQLGERIERAATELAVIIEAGVERQIADRAWSAYQHPFAGNASRAARTADDIDFDTALMRLAAGGTAPRTDAQAAGAPQPAGLAEGHGALTELLTNGSGEESVRLSTSRPTIVTGESIKESER
jgi:FMN reductase